MKTSQLGLLVGLVLGIVAIWGGFLAFLGVAFIGALGLVIGMIVEGRIDLNDLTAADRRRR